MIKVLHVYKTYYPDTFGGVEQVISQLSNGNMFHNTSSTVFVLSNKANEIPVISFDNYKCFRVQTQFDISSTPFSFHALSRFKELAKQADIIHYHYPYPFMDVLHLLANIKKPSIVSYHSDIVKQKFLLRLYRPIMKLFLKRMDYIVAASPNYVNTSQTLLEFKEKVRVIPYGIKDQSSFSSDTVNSNIKELVSRNVKGYFLFVGAFRYYKGLIDIIKATIDREYPIVLAGDGPLRTELENLIRQFNIKNIYLTGMISDEEKFYLIKNSTAILFPSHLRSEAFGISLVEGQMFSKPLISCEIGTGTSYINIGNETGVVIPPSNPEKLRDAMDLIWRHPEIAEKYGRNGRVRYEELFVDKKMVDEYYSLYQSVLK